jgi:hypothetical protein
MPSTNGQLISQAQTETTPSTNGQITQAQTESPTRRTTILLRSDDQENLSQVAELLNSSDTDAIRRALRLTKELLEWQQDGGQIILQKKTRRERLRFLI